MGVQKETSLVYWLRDETGTVLARQYVVDPSDPVGVMWGYDSHDMDRGSGYVHVIGNLFTSAGGYYITIHRILPVNSVDSIVHHTMKVIQTFLTFGKQFVGTASQSVTSMDATLENVVIQALQMLQQETPQGVPLGSILTVLREYGITEDQVR